jgi:LAGLIDADG endonuclease
MPGLVGGFGKNLINIITHVPEKRNFIKKEKELNIATELELRSKLGSYLAGLIESDGTIAVHDKNSNAKKYNPKIAVVFNLADEPLANKLLSITNAGTILKKKDAGHILWQIKKLEDVIKIIKIINGYMRTPKIEALHRAINWLNEFSTQKINCLNLDLSPIDSNAWLAGFTDGDGNFSINLIDRKKNGQITSKRIQTFFRLELRQTYHRYVSVELGGDSYFSILNKIASYLDVYLLSRTREQNDKVFYAFMVISHSAASHEKLINYFNLFPLYSSKYLAFKDWSYVVELSKLRAGKVLTPEEILEVKKIKEQFNSKRKLFDFSHLDNLI